jgi:hypothetical protein
VLVATGAQSAVTARAQLERVLHSEAFRNSDSLRHLLAYLGEKALTAPNEEIKEYTIGIEACGKPSSYDPQKDASVRVQVGRLRGKLEDYYGAEGAADPIILELPKGRFLLQFRPRSAAPAANTWSRVATLLGRFRRISPVEALLAALLAGALLWVGLLYRQLGDQEAQVQASARIATAREFAPLWGPFFSRRVPATAIFGSPGFFASRRYSLFTRLYGLTNPDDPRSSPDFGDIDKKVGPLDGPRFDYASMGDAIAVQRLTAFFASAGFQLNGLPAHLAVWETIKDHNLIFVGAWRMHPLLRRLPVTQDFELGADNQIHNHNPLPGEQSVYTTTSHRNSMTYAVVGLFPGLKPGLQVMVVTAHSSPGASGAIDYITSPGCVRLLEERMKLASAGPRKYFQMLLRIHADNDVPVKTEYVTHHVNQ